MTTSYPRDVDAAVEALLASEGRCVLAISGGRDSMALLRAIGERRPGDARWRVATFDHGTGPAARAAVRLVRREAARWKLAIEVGRAREAAGAEAAWRAQRWEFLQGVARRHGGPVVTAHTLDDHLETLVMRVLRGTGGRGLAGLRAATWHCGVPVVRPLVDVPRAAVAGWATAHNLRWVEDPSNEDGRHFRNRLRRDLLPALSRVAPTLLPRLDELSQEMASIRATLRELAAPFATASAIAPLAVDRRLLDFPPRERRVLWAALLESVGVFLDARGYARLGSWDASVPVGCTTPLSGGGRVTAMRDLLLVHRAERPGWAPVAVPPEAELEVGGWVVRSRGGADTSGMVTPDSWSARVVSDGPLTVRSWLPGDRWCGPGSASPRLVTRYLAEAGVPTALRKGWPVFESRGEIVWVPGVRRAPAASVPNGRSTRLLRCEFLDR